MTLPFPEDSIPEVELSRLDLFVKGTLEALDSECDQEPSTGSLPVRLRLIQVLVSDQGLQLASQTPLGRPAIRFGFSQASAKIEEIIMALLADQAKEEVTDTRASKITDSKS